MTFIGLGTFIGSLYNDCTITFLTMPKGEEIEKIATLC